MRARASQIQGYRVKDLRFRGMFPVPVLAHGSTIFLFEDPVRVRKLHVGILYGVRVRDSSTLQCSTCLRILKITLASSAWFFAGVP